MIKIKIFVFKIIIKDVLQTTKKFFFFFQFFQNRFPNDAGPFEAAASKTP